MAERLKTKCFTESVYKVGGVLRDPGRPAVAYLVTPDEQRKYVGGAFITLNQELRETALVTCASKCEAGQRRRGEAGY